MRPVGFRQSRCHEPASGNPRHPRHCPALNGSRPVSVPLYQTSTFAFTDPAACAEALNDPDAGFAYSRYRNPTTQALEDAVADLEGAAAIATSSGMGAINGAACPCSAPATTSSRSAAVPAAAFSVFTGLAARYGIDVSYITGRDPAGADRLAPAGVPAAVRRRSPNPTVAVSDQPAARGSRAAGLMCVVDNTFATPVLSLGRSSTAPTSWSIPPRKYLGGHDDVTLGLIVPAPRDAPHALEELGGLRVAADPFAAWLTVRGPEDTLPADGPPLLQRRFSCRTPARPTRRWPRCCWPGLASHPDHAVARRLLSGYGGMVAFDVTGWAREAGLRFTNGPAAGRDGPVPGRRGDPGAASRLHLPPAAGRGGFARGGHRPRSIRVSVGLEHPEDLWADFEQVPRRRPGVGRALSGAAHHDAATAGAGAQLGARLWPPAPGDHPLDQAEVQAAHQFLVLLGEPVEGAVAKFDAAVRAGLRLVAAAAQCRDQVGAALRAHLAAQVMCRPVQRAAHPPVVSLSAAPASSRASSS